MTDNECSDTVFLIDKIVNRMNGGAVIKGRSLHVDFIEMPSKILDEFLSWCYGPTAPTAATLLNGKIGYFYRDQNLYLVRGKAESQQFVGYHDGSDKSFWGNDGLLPVSERVGFALPLTPSLKHYALSAEEKARLSNEED